MRFLIFFNLIVASKFFGIQPFNAIDWNTMAIVSTFMTIAYSKVFVTKNLNINLRNIFVPVFLALFFGMFVAFIDWKQSFSVSIVAMRGMIVWLLLIPITRNSRIKEDIFVSLKWFTGIYVCLVLSCFLSPQISLILEGVDFTNGKSKDEHLLVGLNLIILFYYWNLSRLTLHNLKINKSIIFFLFFLCVLFIVGNRTTLIAFTALSICFFLSLERVNKLVVIIVLSLIFLIVVTVTISQLESWYLESLIQINDEDYNRNKAFKYYWTDYSRSFFGYLFGNGFASTHSNFGEIYRENTDNGIFQSDLGLFGLWSHFGLIMLYVVLNSIYLALRLTRKTSGVFFMGIHVLIANILFSAITPEQIIFWVFFICILKFEIYPVTRPPESYLFYNSKMNSGNIQ